VKIRAIGRIGFDDAWQQMLAFTDARSNDTEDELWIVEHAPVFTQGVAGKPEHLLINPSNIPVIKTDRGGQITYHGPGQAMVYILFDLRRAGYGVRELVMRIENAVIATLRAYGVEAYGKRDAPGVYVRSSLEPLSRKRERGRGEGVSAFHTQPPTTRKVPGQLVGFARELRTTTTDAESLLWHLLRNRALANAKFQRQHPTRGNDARFILDFFCAESKLGIELDGSQHFDQAQSDKLRDAWFALQGIRVLRFWNNDVLQNTNSVLEVIHAALVPSDARSPLTPLPLAGEGDTSALQERESAQATTPPAREAKIAALGLKIRNGCSYHGVALNVNMDLTPFSFINPCGYGGLAVTHLHDFDVNDPANDVAMRLARELQLQLALPPPPKA
jgi:lipoate-protein ligase B/very-short-patch-repair endonuclease